jgi:probable rRNA maturation factor
MGLTILLQRSADLAPLKLPPKLRVALRRLSCLHGARDGEVTVRLVGNQEIRRLNAIFRHTNAITDVLSFTYALEEKSLWGDIVIGLGRAERQARQRRISLYEELVRLIVHGYAHLQGYGHDAPTSFMEMRRYEFETIICIV